MERCPKCDTILKSNQKFCTKCGFKILPKKEKLETEILAKIDVIQKRISNDNMNTILYLELGDVYFESKMFKEAILEYQKAYNIDNDSFNANFKTGEVYTELKKFNKAEICYSKACEIDQKSQKAKLALYFCFYKLEKYTELISIGNEIQPNNRNLDFHISLKTAYQKLNNTNEAFKQMLEVNKLVPDNVNNLKELAASYQENKETDKSLKLYEKILSINPLDIISRFIIGKKLFYSKDYNKTIDTFEKYITVFTDDKYQIAYIFLIYSYLQTNKIEKAIDTIRIINISKMSYLSQADKMIISEMYLRIGIYLFEKKKFSNSIKYLENAIEFDPGNKILRTKLSEVKEISDNENQKIKKNRTKKVNISLSVVVVIIIIAFALMKFLSIQKDNSALETAKDLNTKESYSTYLSEFPKGKHISEVDSLLEKAVWEDANKENSYKSYKGYLKDYPQGKYSIKASFLREESLKNKFAFIQGATYQMKKEVDKKNSNYTIDGFYIGMYEVTYKEYIKFLNSNKIASHGDNLIHIDEKYCCIKYKDVFYFEKNEETDNENCPVAYVTWYGADAYCRWVGGRLPSDTEWQIAAKGGHRTKGYKYSGSNDVNEVGWYSGNSGYDSHPVGLKKANELGIYDMSGNLQEWCDTEGDYTISYKQQYTIGSEWVSRTKSGGRIMMGGSFFNDERNVKCSSRSSYSPDSKQHNMMGTMGFRVVLDSK
jgi:formylglycine-generating enzyme required for sulfatase activity/lipopolysaccharide biosynthesis regulator YciM